MTRTWSHLWQYWRKNLDCCSTRLFITSAPANSRLFLVKICSFFFFNHVNCLWTAGVDWMSNRGVPLLRCILKCVCEDRENVKSLFLILDFIWAKDNGGGDDNWSYKSCKAPVKSSPPANQHPAVYRPDALPVAQPTASQHWRSLVMILCQWTFIPFILMAIILGPDGQWSKHQSDRVGKLTAMVCTVLSAGA